VRDLLSEWERRHRNEDDFPDVSGTMTVTKAVKQRFQRVGRYYDSRLSTNGDASDPYSQATAEWPGFLLQQPWTLKQCKVVNRLLKKYMAATGESMEQAAKAILKQLKEKREGVKEDT